MQEMHCSFLKAGSIKWIVMIRLLLLTSVVVKHNVQPVRTHGCILFEENIEEDLDTYQTGHRAAALRESPSESPCMHFPYIDAH